jgi:hypothetical protein
LQQINHWLVDIAIWSVLKLNIMMGWWPGRMAKRLLDGKRRTANCIHLREMQIMSRILTSLRSCGGGIKTSLRQPRGWKGRERNNTTVCIREMTLFGLRHRDIIGVDSMQLDPAKAAISTPKSSALRTHNSSLCGTLIKR